MSAHLLNNLTKSVWGSNDRFRIKILVKSVDNTENLYIFVLGNHSEFCLCFIDLEHYKVYNDFHRLPNFMMSIYLDSRIFYKTRYGE